MYTYDAGDQLTGVSFMDGLTPAVTNITYDGAGHRTGMQDATGTSTWAWDSLDRLVSSKDGYGKTVTYGYDLAGHTTSTGYPGIGTVTRSFDAAGRMEWLQDWKSNKTTFSYDANANLTKTTLPTATGVTDSYSYDQVDNLSATAIKKATTTLAAFAYTRDGASQLATSSTTGISEPAQTYGYTALEQLNASGPSATPDTYSYDTAGNLTAKGANSTLAYDAANQLCWQQTANVSAPDCGSPPTGATTFSYDTNGNRTQATPASGNPTTYGYDEHDRLTRYNNTAATYIYDGDGLRLSKTVSGSTKRSIWDHAGTLPQLLNDGTNSYIYGPDGLPLEQITSSGTVTYLHHDQLGSTRLLTNGSGANVGTYTYDPYGKQTGHTGTAATTLGYTGQYTDAESGLIYLRARYYDPSTGQFLSKDPIGIALRETNYYHYTSGNPINRTDPSGLRPQDAPKGWEYPVPLQPAGPPTPCLDAPPLPASIEPVYVGTIGPGRPGDERMFELPSEEVMGAVMSTGLVSLGCVAMVAGSTPTVFMLGVATRTCMIMAAAQGYHLQNEFQDDDDEIG